MAAVNDPWAIQPSDGLEDEDVVKLEYEEGETKPASLLDTEKPNETVGHKYHDSERSVLPIPVIKSKANNDYEYDANNRRRNTRPTTKIETVTTMEPYVPEPVNSYPYFQQNNFRPFRESRPPRPFRPARPPRPYQNDNDSHRYERHKQTMDRLQTKFTLPRFSKRNFEPISPPPPLPEVAPAIAVKCVHCERMNNIPDACTLLCYKHFFCRGPDNSCVGPDTCHFKHRHRIGEIITANIVTGEFYDDVSTLKAKCQSSFDRHDDMVTVSLDPSDIKDMLEIDVPFPHEDVVKGLIKLPMQMLVFGK